MAGCQGKEKFSLPQLAVYRGKSVDEVLAKSVEEHLERSNFNYPTDIDGALRRIGAATRLQGVGRDLFRSLMARRHHIVHRTDRNDQTGGGSHSPLPLPSDRVERWREAVRDFGRSLLDEF